MYTLGQVVNASIELMQDQGVSSEKAAAILDILEVPDAEERVKWYNLAEMDLTDIEELANVPFTVQKCDNCGDVSFIGSPASWDNFQGVWQGEEMSEVTLQPMGSSAALCGECIGTIERMLRG